MHLGHRDEESSLSTDMIRQVSPDAVRELDLQPQASVRCSIEAPCLSGVKFFHDEDDFDAYQAAVLRLDPVKESKAPLAVDWQDNGPSLTFMIQRYDHEPLNTLTIFLPEWLRTNADVARALERIMAALHLSSDVVVPTRGGKAAA
jgi:hypothetical protein